MSILSVLVNSNLGVSIRSVDEALAGGTLFNTAGESRTSVETLEFSDSSTVQFSDDTLLEW